MCFWDIVLDYICPILSALGALGVFLIAWIELIDNRKSIVKIRFEPPAPDKETSHIQKLCLVVENNGLRAMKKVKVYSCPPLRFGYTSSVHGEGNVNVLNYKDRESFNCFDPMGDILSQQYCVTVRWKGLFGTKHFYVKNIYWSMYSASYDPLPEIKVQEESEEQMIDRIINS